MTLAREICECYGVATDVARGTRHIYGVEVRT